MYTVRNVMSDKVVTIPSDASVREAMRLMAGADVQGLIVTLERGEYGIVTQRDVVGKVVAAGLDPEQVTVVEVCTAPVVTIAPETSLREASARMMDLKVRRMPVCDEANHVIGMVSETDIFMAVEERGWGPDVLGESKLRAIGTLARVRRMQVEEVMSKPVAMIEAGARVSEALVRMAERGISSIIVLPQPGTSVYGIATKRDIIGKVVAQNRNPGQLRVAEIMSAPLYTIAPHVTLPQCAARMVELGVRRLTVTQEGMPVGIVSDTDLFRAVEGRRVSPLDRPRRPAPAPIRHITKSHVHSAADVMGREAVYIGDDATVSEALALMEALDVLSLIVTLERGEYGIVTQRDIISKVVAQERDPDALQVREIASWPILTVAPETSINECSRLMIERNIRRLPVEEGGEIIGVVRDTDIFQAVEERGWEAGPLEPPLESEALVPAPVPPVAATSPVRRAPQARRTKEAGGRKPAGARRAPPRNAAARKKTEKKRGGRKRRTKSGK